MRKLSICNRLFYLIMVLAVMCLGLLSRRFNAYIPDAIDLFLGDSLWALMIYFLIRMLFINLSKKKAVYYGLLFCLMIELSQLYHSSWIDAIRSTTLGGLVLGYGFLWSDLVSYILGISLGYFVDTSISRKKII
ncbi:MAG: DUF2809 domain-containing protein [Sedimentibacter sp.]